MLLCRASLPSMALKQGINSTAEAALQAAPQLQTNRLAGSTWPLRNSYTVKCSPASSCVLGGCEQSILSSDGTLKRTETDMFSAKKCNSVRFIITQRGQLLSRVTPFGFNLSNKSYYKSVFCRNLTYRNIMLPCNWTKGDQNIQIPQVDALESLLFTSGAKVCNQRFCPTSNLQMRALSSVADAPKRAEDSVGDQIRKGGSAKGPEEPSLPESEENKPSKTQQLKKVFKEYGAVGVSFHICISLMSLGMFYLAVSSGIDMAAILHKMGFSETLVESKLAAGTSTFVLAYAVHKLFAPLRISITLVSVPLLVRYLRKTGLFKAPTSP
ncbi:protein FAM210B, mitochondrial [Esox lucius]|uniref:DUF1279 domain-containing protein n=1 Tax=Esox lucius TaxID=8010 RepID=A0A3P8YTX9_ESOLU|nr:protein FAM210B, mitochondrial [Esox lucius]